MGKNQTIKKRRVDVYLRSEDQKDRWNKFADGRKTSLSKLIIETMESMIGGGLMDQLEAKETLTKKIQQLKDEYEKMETNYHRQEKYIEMLEAELNRTKTASFTEPGPGTRHFNKDVIRVLKDSSGPVSNHELPRLVNVNPSDTDQVNGISNQLEALSGYGIVKYGARGWVWNG